MVRSSNGTDNGGLLLVVGQAFPREVCAAALRDLKDDRRLDVSALRSGVKNKFSVKGVADRAASSAALAVEDEVTFCGT